MIRYSARLLIVFILLLAGFSLTNAQNTKKQTLDRIFDSVKECYFSFSFESKEQLNLLSKIISIDHVVQSTVFAYASRDDFEKFLQTNTSYQLLDSPNAFVNAAMFDSKLKQSYAWNEYLSYPDYVDLMYQFAIDYPEICQVFSIGQSVNGRELLVAKISDNIDLKEAEPQFLYSGQIHGNEVATSILMLRLIDYLTANYGTDDQVTRLVDHIEIWINPMANPDGTYAGGDLTVNSATRFNANAVDINRNFPDPEDGDHPDGKSWQSETMAFMALAEAQHFTMSANTHAGTEVVNYPWDTWSRLAADDNWWQLVSREYADLAQLNSPPGYMDGFNNGITNGYAWYSIDGGRQDYMNYFQHCREVTIEQTTPFMPPADELPAYWNYNRQAMLNYLEQVTFGFNGRVTDFDTGVPIEAKIEVDGHDIDNSYVFSNLEGYYYRPIKAGTYTLNYSAEGYDTQSVNNQVIADFDSKTVDILLMKTEIGVDSNVLSKLRITNPVQNYNLHINSPINITQIKIYSILGQLVLADDTNDKDLQLDIQFLKHGVYVVYLEFSSGESLQKRIILP